MYHTKFTLTIVPVTMKSEKKVMSEIICISDKKQIPKVK